MNGGKLVINTELNTKKFDKQITDTQNKLKSLEQDLEDSKDIQFSKSYSQQFIEMEAEAEKLKNKLLDLKNLDLKESLGKIKDISFNPQAISSMQSFALYSAETNGSTIKLNKNLDEMSENFENVSKYSDIAKTKIKDVGETSEKSSNQTEKSFSKSSNILKNFALRIFGIGTAFGIVSRASSAYLSQNEETANKLKSIWTFLGELIGPILDFMADGLLRLIGYLNVFIKALTGVDIVARANAKALNKQAQAQHNLNKETQQYDFDVVRTQTGTTTTGGGISTAGTSGLLEIPELNEGIVQKLKDLAKWLKENYKFLLLIGGVIAGFKIAKWIAGIVSIGKSLSGLGVILKGLLTIGVITLGVELIYDAITGRSLIEDIREIINGIKELKKTLEKNEEAEGKFIDKLQNHTEALAENAEQNNLTKEQVDLLVKSYNRSNDSLRGQISSLEQADTLFHDTSKEIDSVSKQTFKYTEAVEILYKQGLLNNEQTQIYYDMLFEQIRIMEEVGENTDILKQKYETLTGQKYEITFEAKMKENVTSFFSHLKELFPNTAFNKFFDKIINTNYDTTVSSTGYALGGIVTQPTRALIGEAGYNEYIVPEREDYLSRLASMIGQYGSGGVTNVYLDGRLIQRQVSKKQSQYDFSTNV